jgi:hypothetical protein
MVEDDPAEPGILFVPFYVDAAAHERAV